MSVLQFNKNKNQDEIDQKITVNDSVELSFKNDIHFNGRKSKVKNIAENFRIINSFFLDYLKSYNIQTGFLRTEDEKIIFQKHSFIPFKIKVLNIADKRTAEIFGKNFGETLLHPVYEFRLGNNEGNLISETCLTAFDVCSVEEIKAMKRACSKVNAVLKSFFERRNTTLAEFFCSFGKTEDKIIVTGNFTPASFKLIYNDVNPYDFTTINQFKKYIDNISGLIK